MFSKILIANRGEIACRVAATAKKLGVRTVAVYSEADRFAKHVAVCDEAVYIGGSAPKDSYLRWERILEAAKQTGAQAIHPGYGFLSENDEFAQACVDAGLVFIGPPASAITAMGLKAESKRLMEAANVPLIPGYHGTNQDPEFLHSEADKIGYPVLIKASSGGGGKGMRLVEKTEDFIDALGSCQREAISSFGNDSVLIEKYALRPRHIEIQVFGDSHGNYVYLFERDCSVQRRHQKVLEEAPAPGVSVAMREAMGAAAIAAAKAVNYVGAGTVEFIVEQRESSPEDKFGGMNFYFMEMNTRLQVEHPVTEAITGTDLVEWQLRVASGEPLPKQQADLTINGHSIEARINAENPDNNFLPATGTLNVYRTPTHSAFRVSDVRVDDGVREGDVISPYYDSMIAKLIVHAPTREQALAKLDQALAETRIVGLPNNVAFLRHVVQSDSFKHANLDTALIEREKDVLFGQQRGELPWLVATAIVNELAQEAQTQNHDPFSKTDAWRAYSHYARPFELVYHDKPLRAVISEVNGQAFHLTINTIAKAQKQGADVVTPIYQGDVRYLPTADDTFTLWLSDGETAGKRQQIQAWRHNERVYVFSNHASDTITLVDSMAHVGIEPQDGGSLKSPMPGQVVAFRVNVGDEVKKGQALAVIEAMKIEHTINAPADGTVAELLFKAGDLVSDGDELLKLDTGSQS
ncbi:acetyl/propionyl/methylcrotonyl-CoA carboxylase subunit alpha [Moraxella osloensis]|uniref:acetyl/propionyl/methylcrotonyl-CoA carboxylase subunit alpha n=1 Tax=Faucicola osloensis TaxID=34062 RepID=UPI0020052A26|nr:acetyl/propionyl/methylcrotonyl-CoA carboxylase subunit alpha [Moraxella osloensis]MCK6158350.1 acetyl/propionyl/methylcrotonyl-CoA carboxylase subunit alpha [Moraxella osloensis]